MTVCVSVYVRQHRMSVCVCVRAFGREGAGAGERNKFRVDEGVWTGLGCGSGNS